MSIYTRIRTYTYVLPLLPYGCQLPRLPLDKLGILPTWRKMHGIVENRMRPDKTSAGIEHAQAKDSRVNCITAGGRLARTREIKSLASIFGRLAYWAARSSHHTATRANKTVSRALVCQGRTPPAPLLKSENPCRHTHALLLVLQRQRTTTVNPKGKSTRSTLPVTVP